MCQRKKQNNVSVVKVVLITLGTVAAIAAALCVAYKIFKKYFKITFECGDCDFCDEDCSLEDEDAEPECICDCGGDDIFAELDEDDTEEAEEE